jgi:hypothetical protein
VDEASGASNMMSTSLHQYPPAFSHMPPNMVDQHQHLAAQHMAPSPLDTLAYTSQYAMQSHQNRHVLPSGKAIPTGPLLPRPATSATTCFTSAPDAELQRRAPCDGESAERVISAISCGPSVMASRRVRIVLVCLPTLHQPTLTAVASLQNKTAQR